MNMTADEKMEKSLKEIDKKGNISLVEYREQTSTPEEDHDF
jgi:hypothetical protein